MKTEISNLLHQQIVHEFESAYLYLDFSTFFAEKGLHGFCNWFRVQAQEELSHGMLILKYLEDNGVHVDLCHSIEQKGCQERKNILSILKAALSHEQMITHLIESIYTEAASINDLRTMRFLDWFINEQAEEEKNASDLLQEYELYGNSSTSQYLIDQKLKKREFLKPVLV